MNANSTGTERPADTMRDDAAAAIDSMGAALLRAPRTLADTGLPALFVSHLLLKSILQNGKSSMGDLI